MPGLHSGPKKSPVVAICMIQAFFSRKFGSVLGSKIEESKIPNSACVGDDSMLASKHEPDSREPHSDRNTCVKVFQPRECSGCQARCCLETAASSQASCGSRWRSLTSYKLSE